MLRVYFPITFQSLMRRELCHGQLHMLQLIPAHCFANWLQKATFYLFIFTHFDPVLELGPLFCFFFSINDLRSHRLLDVVFSKHNSNFFSLLPNAPCYLEISRLFIDMHNTFLSRPITLVCEPQGTGTN